MKRAAFAIAIGSTFLSGGCSTITQSESQSLALTATYQSKSVEANCQLKNDKGIWDAKAPSNVAVRKSSEDLEVTCKKDGMPDGILKAISRAASSMFGNIIFGGGIGALIDHSKGTGYDYPIQLPVKMGESVIVDRKTEGHPAPASQQVRADSSPRATEQQAAKATSGTASSGDEATPPPADTAPPVGSVLTSKELSDLFRATRVLLMSAPLSLHKLDFRADGNLYAEFMNSVRAGNHYISSGRLCLRFTYMPSNARMLPFMNDCFTVSVSQRTYRFTSSNRKFVMMGEL